MKFLITFQIHDEKRHDTLAMFANMTAGQETAMMGAGVKLIGRWHDLVGCGGAAVYEADSLDALSAYALNWNKFMDLEITPVVDDEEARKIGKQMTG